MIKMLKDTVLVKKIAKEQTSNILMPDSVVDDWERGEVMAVGKGAYDMNQKRVKMEVKVGDIVIFLPAKYSAYPIVNVDGEECIILSESNIAAIE
jgi:chaperonin GroES